MFLNNIFSWRNYKYHWTSLCTVIQAWVSTPFINCVCVQSSRPGYQHHLSTVFVYSHPGLGINTIYQLCLCTVIQACISTIYHLAPEDCTVSVTFKSKLFPVLNMYIYPEYKRSCWVLIKYLIKTH